MASLAARSRCAVPHPRAMALPGVVSSLGERPCPCRRPPFPRLAAQKLISERPASKIFSRRPKALGWSRKFYTRLAILPHHIKAMPHESHRNVARHKTHPWGTPPWSVGFRPAPCALPDQVDFAIVGGGFSGLSTAAWLRRFAPGRSVLVLESASLGDGASGRTGGMALSETAAGKLPGLGDVLAGYKRILRAFRIDSRLTLPGVWEIARSAPAKRSPISWSDSGELKVVRLVPGGSVDPGKVLAGLARAAEKAGAQIVEHASVRALDFSNPLRLHVSRDLGGRIERKEIRAEQVLLATNAYS